MSTSTEPTVSTGTCDGNQLQEGVGDISLEDEETTSGTTQYDNYIRLIRNRIKGEKPPTGKIPGKLMKCILELIWDTAVIEADEWYIRRILFQLSNQFNNANAGNELGIRPSDTEDLLEHKPTEIMADKWCQIFLHLCLGEVSDALMELLTLKVFLSHVAIRRNAENEEGFIFAFKTLELFVNMVSGIDDKLVILKELGKREEGNSEIPIFEDLQLNAQLTVKVMKCFFVRNFRHRSSERLDLLKEIVTLDPSNFEWFITRAEMWRRQRRDSSHYRGKRPQTEEFDLVAEAYVLAPQNPFVKLSLMDCIIDCIRDSRGSFSCGEINFETADETMKFMKDTCRNLCKEFPNSVRINSQISDYYARFVSFRYFDVAFAQERLERAYQLNPINAKTTHRLGIFYRMSKGDIDTSFDWFKKTVKLDPLHFNAFMECVKNMISRMEDYDIIQFMDDKIKEPGLACWTETEILEMLFYKGLVYFVKGEMEKVLEVWGIVYKGNECFFRFVDFDRDAGHYEWDDKLISTDRIRLWIKGEKDMLDGKGDNNTGGEEAKDQSEHEQRKSVVNSLYSIMVGGRGPSRPPRHSSGLFKPSMTLQLLKGKISGAGDQ